MQVRTVDMPVRGAVLFLCRFLEWALEEHPPVLPAHNAQIYRLDAIFDNVLVYAQGTENT